IYRAWKCDDPLTDGVVEEFGERMQSKFLHDFRSVCFYSPDADSEIGGNHLICFPLCQKSNNFSLARSWPWFATFWQVSLLSTLQKPFHYDFGYFGRQKELAC